MADGAASSRTPRRLPGREGLREALGLDCRGAGELSAQHRPRGAHPDKDLARACRRLQPGGRVHRVAGYRQVAARVDGEDLAGLDSDANLDSMLGEPLDHLQPGGDRAVRVVAVRAGHAEHGHHRVADVLLHGAAVLGDHRARQLEERGEVSAKLLGIGARGHLGRADDVGKQQCCELPLRAFRKLERSAAGRAEAITIARLSTAARTRSEHGNEDSGGAGGIP